MNLAAAVRGLSLITTLSVAMASATWGQSAAIPRLVNGKPDLSGIYGGVAPTKVPDPFLNTDTAAVGLQSRDNTLLSFEADSTIQERGDEHRPLYRPQYWQRVRDADLHGNELDTAFNCKPLGVPRMGPPQKIVQTANEVVFLYNNPGAYRVIATDGRPENEFLLAEGNWAGYSRGKWDGDTLVIETSGFTDHTWIGWPGWIHSTDMLVIERMWWQNGKLMWQPTVHDEAVLLEPFAMRSVAITPNANPKADLLPDVPCSERDLEVFKKLNSKIRG
jgi:hypothetical protein